MPTQPEYKRIRIHSSDDDARLYSLIHTYLQDPSQAATVTQISIRRPIPKEHYCFESPSQRSRERAKEASREPDPSPALVNLVSSLNLGAEETAAFLRRITYMSPSAVSSRTPAENSKGNSAFFAHNCAHFSHHAAALLLLLCPNIETLLFEDSLRSGILETVLLKINYNDLQQPSSSSPPSSSSSPSSPPSSGIIPSHRPLQNLKHVHLLPTSTFMLSDERFYTKSDFLGSLRLFHRLPRLHSVSIAGISEDDRGTDRWITPPAISSVKKISITHSDLSSRFLASVIRVPVALEDFEFGIGGRATNDGGFSSMSPETLGRALETQKGSLRKLRLDVDDYIYAHGRAYDDDEIDDEEEEGYDPLGYLRDEWFVRDERDGVGPLLLRDLERSRKYENTIGSLHDFHRLAYLSIGIKTLLGPEEPVWASGLYSGGEQEKKMGRDAPFRLVDGLPPNLETLVLLGYKRGESDRYDGHIDQFLKAREEWYPRLKEVRGIEEMIPSGENVHDPDHNADALWVPEELEDGWLEV